MGNDKKTYKYTQITLILLLASKILGYLTVLGFIAGVFTGEFLVGILTALLFAVPAAICIIISLILDKKEQKIDEEIFAAERQEKELKYEENKNIALEAYEKVCDVIHKPAITYPIEIFTFTSDIEMEILQSKGQWWKNSVRTCDCWLLMVSEEYKVGALCFLESFGSFDRKVRTKPNEFSDIETSVGHVWREIIPIHDIIGLSIVGDVETTSTVSGGDAKYLGVSVNGIGFGEWQVDPVRVRHDIHDKRVLELKYNNDENEIRSIYFPLESADVLEQIMGSLQ